MKDVIKIFTVVLFLGINFQISDSNYSSKSNASGRSISEGKYEEDYKIVRVFIDGVWWIYVYDGTVLIDLYEE